jgi:hypothetical protein
LATSGEDQHEAQAEVVLAQRVVDLDAEQRQVGHADRARGGVVGEPLDAQEGPVEEELCRQRGHRQVQALDAQRRDAEQHARHGGADTAEQDGDDHRHAFDANEEVVGRVGAHRHEGARAQRDLPAVADQDVQPHGGQRHDQEGDQDGAEHVLVGQQRHADDGKGNQQQMPNAVLRDREDLLVGA